MRARSAGTSDDRTIVGSDGSVGDESTFLGVVKSGTLSHDVMSSEDFKVRVYGDTAVVIARGVSGGKYQGHAFREVERSSCSSSGNRDSGGAS